MSWFGGGGVSIEERVEKATSESLPSGEQDLALNLEICDLIRSKTVPAKDAMRALKRRLLHSNPNVQILTLHLTDLCIKNGGAHFLVEVASREFMDSCVLVLKPLSGGVNPDVKQLMLEYLQNWAHAFEGQMQLGYVDKVYRQLKDEGFEFPSAARLTKSFIDSSAPPEWVDSDTCMKSGRPFTFYNRKHHCRNCGGVFLQEFCDKYTKLPHYGINTAVRVCVDCYDKLQAKGAPVKVDKPAAVHRYTSNNQDLDRGPAGDASFDADLKRALELSLADNQHPKPAGAGASYGGRSDAPAGGDDDDDEEMKAAIAASLRDFELAGGQQQQQQNPAQQQPRAPSATAGLYDFDSTPTPSGAATHVPPANARYEDVPALSPSATGASAASESAEELSPLEAELVNRYVMMVDNLQNSPPGTLLRDSKIQALNENVMSLRPKLVRTLTYTIDKSDRLESLHGKLAAVVRYYDKLLEDNLASASHYRGYGGPGGYDQYQPQQQSGPPGVYPAYSNEPMAPQYSGYGDGYPQQAAYQPPQGYGYAPDAPSAPSAPPSAPPVRQEYTGGSSIYQADAVPSQAQAQAPAPAPAPSKPKEEAVLIEL